MSTPHDTPEAAQAALHAYLVLSDYYHRPTQLSAAHAAYELISLAQGQPRRRRGHHRALHRTRGAP
ncbi:hypothetical protein [Mycolicibacterium grossiae]|uniref:hypothetical protein n=1 Tax=Mycolicibacterium grossiae TaxID=1552759 RepID=UPI000A531A12|nr:hypothetical protein [Mycolicibacterium grossiae]